MEKERATVGIDPGTKGAMALLPVSSEPLVVDWKTPQEMGIVLRQWTLVYDVALVALEKVNAMPSKGKGGKTTRMGSQSAFNFGRNVGIWNGLLIGMALPFVEVAPQTWQKGLVGRKHVDGVKPSMAVAQRLYPRVVLYGPKGGAKDGRADSLLMAHWARAQCGIEYQGVTEEADW